MKIFISYRTDDESFAAVTLDARLCERFGARNVFRDSRSIPAGADFEPVLWRSLAQSSILIVVIGTRWLTGTGATNRLCDPTDFVRREISFALEIGLPVLPVLVGDARLPEPHELPDDLKPLASRQYRRLHARTAESDVRLLVDELARMFGAPPPSAGTPVDAHHNVASGDVGNLVQARDIYGDVVLGDDRRMWTDLA